MVLDNKKPFCVGLTGGIGSGKSTVANLFKDLGVTIIDADIIAHEITQPNQEAYHNIVTHFGNDILNIDKTINRRKLREIIFTSKSEKKWLEALLHPLIRQNMQAEMMSSQTPYCICVIPLLAESKGIDFLDTILTVETTQDLQIQRAMDRDQDSKASIQKIINSQANREKRQAIADNIIINDSDLLSLKDKVLQLHQQYSNRCKLRV